MAQSGKSATRDFRRQRLTAFALVPLGLIFVALVVALAGSDYETARACLANPLVAGVIVLLVIATAVHMRIGMNEIIDDYVQDSTLHKLSKTGNFLFCAAVVLGSIYAALKILIGF